jgi:hypothetical protein
MEKRSLNIFKGLKKGVIKTSFEEALSMWIKEQKKKNASNKGGKV